MWCIVPVCCRMAHLQRLVVRRALLCVEKVFDGYQLVLVTVYYLGEFDFSHVMWIGLNAVGS